MFRLIMLGSTCFVLFCGCSCSQKNSRQHPQADTRHVQPAQQDSDLRFETPGPHDSVPAVMHAKLAYAQAVLDALAMANFQQAQNNAASLKRISLSAEWLAHESEAYFEFSQRFRSICDDLGDHARAHNLRAMVSDYNQLVNSCVGCHEYLRNERARNPLPGRLSRSE